MPLKLYRRGRLWHCRGTVAGRLVRESLRTSDRALAEHAANKIESRILREAILGKSAEATFANACARYFEDHPIRKSGRDQMSAFLAPIIKELGAVRLIELTPGQVRAAAKRLYPDWKPQSLNTAVIAPVSAVVNHAHQFGWCPPMRIRRFPEKDVRIRKAVTREWLDEFMRHASPHVAAFALFCFTTGARPQEACNLRPEQIDLARGLACSDETKNGKRRIFYLSGELVAVLCALPPRVIPCGKHSGEIRVFGFSDRGSLREPWIETCKLAGIDYRSRYEAGLHSHFTETVVRHGADVVTAAKLGNVTPAILLKHYAHSDAPEELAKRVFGAKSAQKAKKIP